MKNSFLFVIILLIFSINTRAQIWPSGLVGWWTFDNGANLTQAKVGNDLVLVGNQYITTGVFSGDGAVAIDAGSYYRCRHGILPNGAGVNVNEYTLLFDFKVPDVSRYRCFYQTNPYNSNDGEVFINKTGNIGIRETGYSGISIEPNSWHRLVVVVDLGDVIKYYLDGHLILNGISQTLDGRFSLDPQQLLFLADNDGEDNIIYISQIALFNRPLAEAEVYGLGGLKSSNIHPYLQTSSASGICISWNSYQTASTLVQYGTTPGLGNLKTGSYEDISNNRWHTVQLTGLQENTRYYYRCISGNDTSGIYPFRTPAKAGTAGAHVRFAIIGDSQNNEAKSSEIADSMLNTFIRNYGNNWFDSLAFIMHNGDIVQDGNDIGRYMNEYFNPFSKLSCSVPFMVAIGNHEDESPFYYQFMKYETLSGYSANSLLNEKYYSFYLGDCQFIMMNTNESYNNDEQLNWLHQRLLESDANPQCDFVFVCSHEPGQSEIWPKGNEAYVQNRIYPELGKFPKVCFSSHGHAHDYQRGAIQSSHSKRWDFGTIISGGGGGVLDRWYDYSNQTNYQDVQFSLDHYHYLLVDVDEDAKTCETTMYSLGNEDVVEPNVVLDRWHRRINQAAPEKPIALSPSSVANIAPVLSASAFQGRDLLMSSRFQLDNLQANWTSPLLDVLRNSDDYYGITSNYEPVNLNAGINLQEYAINAGLLQPGLAYKWRVCYRDQNLRWSDWSDSLIFNVLPSATSSNIQSNEQNNFYAYPNPFSSSFYIEFTAQQADYYSICITDLEGKSIRTVAAQKYPAGQHRVYVDCANPCLPPLTPGVYFCQLRSSSIFKVIRIVCVR
jgi:hypothetical protein